MFLEDCKYVVKISSGSDKENSNEENSEEEKLKNTNITNKNTFFLYI